MMMGVGCRHFWTLLAKNNIKWFDSIEIFPLSTNAITHFVDDEKMKKKRSFFREPIKIDAYLAYF